MTLQEAHRILNRKGELVIAILDKETPFGKFLDNEKGKDPFYKHARFFSVPEIRVLMGKNNFRITQTVQTLEDPASRRIEDPEDGFGNGSFVVIKGVKV